MTGKRPGWDRAGGSRSGGPRTRGARSTRAREPASDPGRSRPSGPSPPPSAARSRPSISPLWAVFLVAGVIALGAIVFFGPLGGRLPLGESAGATGSGGGATGCPTSQPAPLASGETRTVTIETESGRIELRVEGSLSPIAAGNFVALASCGYYDDVVFHRAATLQDGTPFVIQGGDPTGTGRGGPGYTIQDEPVTATYGRGTVAMARSRAPNSVGSQFFIVLDDRARSVLESFNTYQIIGTVTAGMEVADAIYAAADAELPSDPVTMTKVTVSTP